MGNCFSFHQTGPSQQREPLPTLHERGPSQHTVWSQSSQQTGRSQQIVLLPSSQQAVSGPSQQTLPSPPSQQAESYQETPPRSSQETPLSLDEVIAQLKAINDVSKVDEIIKIIRDHLPLPSSQQAVWAPSQHTLPPASQPAVSYQETPPLSSQEIRPSSAVSYQETPPLSSQEIRPSLDEVKDQLKAVNDLSKVDELIKIIRYFLQWRAAGKSLKDKAESSQSVAWGFIRSGTTFFKFLINHVEKSRNKEDFVSSAPQIIGDVLEKLGNVHWLVAGLSVIGYLLHTADAISENYNRCLDLLEKLVDLSDHVKQLDHRLPYQEVKLKRATVMIVEGCILCASQLSSYNLSRFLKASVNAAVLSNFEKEIDDLRLELILMTVEQRVAIRPQTPPAYSVDAESNYVGEDVFLSHSGVQKNFVRQLHRDLTREGVSCFFDENRQCLPLAEKWAPRIFEAAEKCRVAVLLLSVDFIQSRWPMLELSAFMKAKDSGKNFNLKILPLFFKISPDDLKDLTSNTQDIPDRTRQKRLEIKWKEIPEETQVEWKEALQEVRKINGLRFNGEDEVSFRDEIIEEIRTLLPPSSIVSSMPVEVVGLAEGQEKVIELLQLTSADRPRMALVIYGFGGIGKTTLAEAVVAKVDLKPYHYARVNFDIGSSKKDIRKMQEKILNCLFPNNTQRTKTKFTDCCEGRTVLREAFQKEGNKPIFLFIDNAPRKQDLEELLPRDMKGLPKGSRILVTTRYLGTTDMFIEDGLERRQYPVQPLSDKEAKNFLLQGCAGLQLDYIQEKDVKRILKICNGVPLVLKIVRGHLRKQGYRADRCSLILENLERGEKINQEDLGSTLTDFVYDQWEPSSKQAFLDICCFFYNMDPSYVEYIVGAQELTSLEEAGFAQRSDDKKTLIVHDIIRERGRNKAGLESAELVPTRIMNVESLIDAANQQKLKDIRGVWLIDEDESEDRQIGIEDKPECVVEEQHLTAMTKLRVLALGKRMRVRDRCEVTFKELRYLKVGGDIACLPVNLEKLPKLVFYVGPLFKNGFSMYKLPIELRVLIAAPQSDFNESTYSEESRAVKNSSLKELDLSSLKNLQEVPQGLHLLTSLEILRWNDWDRMEELPEQVKQLTMLTQLTLSGWTSLTCLPAGFGRLKGLKDLNLCKCKALQCLPESFGELKALKDLYLHGCEALQCLPESFGELKALKYLDLSRCEALKRLPESFGLLAAVEKLKLSCCTGLECLPESFGELKGLKCLDLDSCEALKRLSQSFWELKALKYLNLSHFKALERLPESFGQLAALEKLKLSWCIALQCLPESLGELKALKYLDLSYCKALERLPESFGRLEAVEKVKFSHCTALQCLPESFRELKALKDLDLDSCKALERLPESFWELKALKYLDLSLFKALERLPESFGQLSAVEKLKLSWCIALQCLPKSFGELKALKYIDLSNCKALERLPESFGQLAAVEKLELRSCTGLQCLPESFGGLKALKYLDLSYCVALERLPESFGELTALEYLDLFYAALERLPESFGELKALKYLNLSRGGLERLPESFGQLAALETLDLIHCTALQCLTGSFGELKALKYLDLSDCKAMQRLPESFGELTALENLDLSYCKALERLPESFRELTSLRYIEVADCPARADLRQFEANLRHVTIRGYMQRLYPPRI